ncbi:sterol regulatory element-binding protein cleavage-activating protein [Eurytemora carolleeae]|uniref:sterol regulatory element-binding protein cleavage-activating protein n=1 Tax=Eurytemora carolleeae TaxID=1294199 RepID=UPI000C78EF04|nr:sterol regulatory element-binding protein cleavage-activating protein [Eurytemora carolleeae]|eukprot:XP_023324574.1 sterol regulatory element-binding protein cleavage-activating protein-like [Eurytemora affinis]
MFGLRQRDTGLTKYPVRNRQRIITYSVTLVLRQHKPQFINQLRQHLSQLYPLHPGNSSGRLVHIHFPEQINGTEYIPYTALLIGLFFYTFYSCRKIDLIQSKVGIALTAVITILGSLFMSLGLTGQSLGGTGYVYLVPYANAFIGLENILVITRSIVSTPEHLDVKEFCIFAVMGLLCDFYLQHFFFVTVFSMDISRTGLVDVLRMPRNLSRKPRPSSQTSSQSLSQQQQQANIFQQPISGPGGRYEVDGTSSCPSLVAPSLTAPPRKVPKRVQIN